MPKPYVTGFPTQVLVADKFHLVTLGNDMVTSVRQRVIRKHEGRRGRKVDPAWQVRRRLLTRPGAAPP
jgi:transposase